MTRYNMADASIGVQGAGVNTSMDASTSAGIGSGVLWLVPTPLDFGTAAPALLSATIAQDVIYQATQITHWIVENAKTARAVLKRFGEVHPLAVPLQQMQITELPRHVHKQGDSGFKAHSLLKAAAQGHDMGLMSEAGLPAIADPGAAVVRAAHELHIGVRPLVGPSSLILALMGSGLNGQSFAFVGYLPVQAGERSKRIKELEKLALRTGQTQLFIETPYRNEGMLHALIGQLELHTQLCVAFGMTLPGALQVSMTVAQWRKTAQDGFQTIDLTPEVMKLPAVFVLGR